jgi:3-hydroxybutyryl-CoA dehydratase
VQKGNKTNLSFVIDENVYKGFISTFKDTNPLHTDAEFAVSKGYTSCVMHGNILNGFLSYFVGECLPSKNVIIHSQQIHYNLPVYLNDVLNFEAELVDIFESVKTYEFKFQFVNAENKKVAKGKIQIGLI